MRLFVSSRLPSSLFKNSFVINFISVFILFFIFIPSISPAITIDEAVNLALDNNHQILEQVHTVNAQREKVLSGKTALLPDIDFKYSYTRQDNVFSIFQTKNSSIFRAEVALNLFNGFIDINKLREGKELLNASIFQKKSVWSDIVLEVKKSYIQLLKTGENLKTTKEAVKLLEKQSKVVRSFFREGMVTRNDVLKVEVELASSKQKLFQSESELRIARNDFERIIGVQLEENELLKELGPAKPISINEESLREEMLKNRNELKYLDALKKSMVFSSKAIRGRYYPDIDLSFSYSSFGDSAKPSDRELLHDSEAKTSIVASWEIMERFKSGYDRSAKDSEVRAIDEKIKDTIKQLSFQLMIVLEKQGVASSMIKVADKALKQAEENYRITYNQFKERIATSTDLLDSRLFLTRARNNHINAVYDIHESVAEIERVVESSK